jgi:hypothetical protein
VGVLEEREDKQEVGGTGKEGEGEAVMAVVITECFVLTGFTSELGRAVVFPVAVA